MDDFVDMKVVVTGASSGIGAGLAEEFAKRGAAVGICARRQDRLEEVLRKCQAHSPSSRMWVTDLAVPEQVDAFASSVLAEFGTVDILVNNAGVPKRRKVTELDLETVQSVMNINYFAPVALTLALLPSMVGRGRGHIVNVSSIAATLSSPGEAAYDGSKAALTAFSEAMAIELWNTGVKVLVVYPGLIETELFSLPDNDPVVNSPVEPLPVGELVRAVFDALADGSPQVYVPAWFHDVAVSKATDLAGFMAGAAAFLADQQAPQGAPSAGAARRATETE